ncbi:ferredoxin [Marivibrio halodurans]|uniref:ferredoxin n=1 Tax=Marivibrio halodurans TaxID=2039722 RepID=UPI0031BB163B
MAEAPAADPRLAALAHALAPKGLIARGGFHPTAEDGLDAATVVMIGNAGPALWRVFEGVAARDTDPHPMDRWTRAVMEDVAALFGARALYPFGGPPYHPFQRWAMRAEAVHPSPLGLLIHPDYGLWHAYRAALLFRERLALPPRDRRPSPCESCVARPCLSTCPVGAFDAETGYDVPACTAHIRSPAGTDCLDRGCRARHACPVGSTFTYDDAQSAFHMGAFERAR